MADTMECVKDESDETCRSLHDQLSPSQHNLIQTTECFKEETSSNLRSESSSTQHNLEKHYESSETQSFTVEIKVMVEKERKEILSETKADTTEQINEEHHCLTEQSKDKSVDQEEDWNSSDESNNKSLSLVSTLRDENRVEAAPAIRSKMKSKRSRSDKHRRSRSRTPSRYRRHESPDRRRRSYSRDRSGRRSRRRNRSSDRSKRTHHRDARSRSRSRHRRCDTPDRSRRSYSRDRERRSRSRSRHRRGDTPNRYRRSYSRDRVRRSRSHSRHRRDDTPDRSRRSYSRDRERRSRSRSRHRRGDTPDRSQRSYSRDRDVRRSRSRSHEETDGKSLCNYLTNRDAEQARNNSNCQKEEHLNRWYSSTDNRFEGNEKASSSSVDNSNGSAETKTVADQQAQEIFSRDSTIGILRSRIQSSLSRVFSNTSSITHKNWSSESTRLGDVDDNIIKTIVSREMSSNRMHSNVNIDMAADRTVDQRVQNNHNSQIRDPRILRMLTSQRQQAPPGNPSASRIDYNDFRFSTSGSSANPSSNPFAVPSTPANFLTPMFNQPTFESQINQQTSGNIRRRKQTAPLTYGEYKRLQESAATDDKETIVKSIPIRNVTTDPMQIKREGKATQKTELHEKLEPDNLPRMYGRIKANNNAPRMAIMQAQGKAPRIALPTNLPKIKSGESRVNATKNATKMTVLHDERKANTETTMPKKEDVRQLQGNVNATGTEDKTSNETAMNALGELMNPQQFLTLVDLMEQMTENNSLVKVKEALGQRATETHTSTPKKAAEVFSASANYAAESTIPKKRSKNELDRLHEDIDNMFIRDGVLNANGRRRNRAQTIVQPSYEAVIESRKQNIKNTPRTLKRSVSTFNYEIAHSPLTATRTSPLQTIKVRKVVKNEGSSEAADDPDWVLSKRVPLLVLKKLPPMTNKQSVVKVPPMPLVSQKPRIKNNNIELHSLKKIVTCQVCDSPPGVSLMSHYINNHPQCEVLTSRISPEAAQFLRSSTTKDIETINPGNGPLMYKNFCYFCNIYRTYTKACWVDHMTRHTGYYLFKCSNCSRKFASRPLNHSCRDRSYIERMPMPIFQPEHVKAFVCELCNYVRFYEAEMEMHLNNEHDDGERKAFKEFTFLIMPKKKNVTPLKKCNCKEESTSEIKSEPVFEQESASEVKMENVFEEESGFQAQTANTNANCDEYSVEEYPVDEEYDFKVLTEKLGKICSDTSLSPFQYDEGPNF